MPEIVFLNMFYVRSRVTGEVERILGIRWDLITAIKKESG